MSDPTPEEIKRATALFFDAIDTHGLEEDQWGAGYFDREMGTLDGRIDEIMPALLAYGWTPPNVDPLPQPEREQPAPPVETWTGPTFGPIHEGDVVAVTLGGEQKLFKVDRQRGSSITHGLTKMECTRVDGDEQISVDLDRRERLQQIAASMPIIDAPIGFVDDGIRLVQDPDTGEQTWVKRP